jgi:hypothetical protein
MSSLVKSKAAARERIAAMRAARARSARRRRIAVSLAAIAMVVVVIAGLIVAKTAGLGSGGTSANGGVTGPATAAEINEISAVSASTFNTIGAGTTQLVPQPVKAPALSARAKPRILYIGAEYCPYCAAQRWPVAVALARFGTWTGLGITSSSSSDVYPDTPTLSFHGATYTSPYLAFTGVETQGRDPVDGQYPTLDSPTKADQRTFATYDQPPYVQGTKGSIPFIDIGGRYLSNGASYSPDLLKARTTAQVARALANPANPIAKAVDGSADAITAAICNVTGERPASVCATSGVTTAAGRLGGSGGQ